MPILFIKVINFLFHILWTRIIYYLTFQIIGYNFVEILRNILENLTPLLDNTFLKKYIQLNVAYI